MGNHHQTHVAMKVLKYIFIGLLGLIILIGIVGFFLPTQLTVSESIAVKKAAGPSAFNMVNDLKQWPEWSPWLKLDPDMKLEYGASSQGAGASYSWQSEKQNVGNGSLKIVESKANEFIKTEMAFEGQGEASASYFFKDTGNDAVEITWTFEGDMGSKPIGGYLVLLFKGAIAADYQKGLASLKQKAESM